MPQEMLRKIREEQGLSVRAVAEQIGPSKSTYHRWEKKDKVPEEKAREVAEALGVSLDELRDVIESPDRSDVVQSKAQLADWSSAVGDAALPFVVTGLLRAFGDFWLPRAQVAVFTKKQLAERTRCDQAQLEEVWEEVRACEFVEIVADDTDVRWVFILKFPEGG